MCFVQVSYLEINGVHDPLGKRLSDPYSRMQRCRLVPGGKETDFILGSSEPVQPDGRSSDSRCRWIHRAM
jgi:hypothetical protein